MEFRGPMVPWPDLERYARRVSLPGLELELFLYDTGAEDKPVLLLLHGLGDEADTWRHLIPALADRVRVVAPDLPGFGRSDKPRRSYTLPFLGDTVLALLDLLDAEQAILGGNSLGAAIAQLVALEHPRRVRHLILIDGGLLIKEQRLSLRGLLFLVPLLGEWLYKRLRADPDKAFATLRPYYANLDALPEEERTFLYRRVNQRVWSSGQQQAYLSALRRTALWLAGRRGTLPEQLAQLQTPTLIVWGEEDHLLPPQNAEILAAAQPEAELVLVPEAGHLPHQERPQAVLEAIREQILKQRSKG